MIDSFLDDPIEIRTPAVLENFSWPSPLPAAETVARDRASAAAAPAPLPQPTGAEQKSVSDAKGEKDYSSSGHGDGYGDYGQGSDASDAKGVDSSSSYEHVLVPPRGQLAKSPPKKLPALAPLTSLRTSASALPQGANPLPALRGLGAIPLGPLGHGRLDTSEADGAQKDIIRAMHEEKERVLVRYPRSFDSIHLIVILSPCRSPNSKFQIPFPCMHSRTHASSV